MDRATLALGHAGMSDGQMRASRTALDEEVRVRTTPLEPVSFLASLVQSSDDAIIGKSCDGVVVFWNDAATRLYGYSADEMIGKSISVLIPDERQLELSQLLAAAGAGQTMRSLPTERLRKDGTRVLVSITVSPVLDHSGDVIGISTIAHDMTLQVRQLEDLREAHRRADETLSMLETLQSSAPVGLGFVDAEFRILHLNEVLASFVREPAENLVGQLMAEAVPDIWSVVESDYRRVFVTGEAIHNVEVSSEISADPGRMHHWLASYYPVRLQTEVIGLGVVVIDITERRRAEEFRSVIMDNLAEGLFTVDTDGRLTSMNNAASTMLGWSEGELMGHPVRDFILPPPDSGDEFEAGNLELLRVRAEGKHVQLEEHAYRCRNGSLLPVSISASPLFIGGSIEGAAVVFRDITESQSERHRIRRELDALTWVGRIREALDEDRLVLHAQPIIPLRGGPPSEELLLRMVDRGGKLVGPDSFLGVAEKYGLITEIDEWVVKSAIRLASTGRRVAANLSAESIMSRDLLGLIESELHRVQADPSNLVFEITETALMGDIERGHTFARGITDLGCGIALDDFGTGYGTFRHVKELDVTYLKIDIEFVRELSESPANQHVVKAIVNLAEGFGCETIAEGVEDGDSLELLRELGVDYAQGFYLGRPAAIKEL